MCHTHINIFFSEAETDTNSACCPNTTKSSANAWFIAWLLKKVQLMKKVFNSDQSHYGQYPICLLMSILTQELIWGVRFSVAVRWYRHSQLKNRLKCAPQSKWNFPSPLAYPSFPQFIVLINCRCFFCTFDLTFFPSPLSFRNGALKAPLLPCDILHIFYSAY